MIHSKLSIITVTLCFTAGIALIELAVSQFASTGITADLMLRSVAIGALCGLIVDTLRFAAGNVSLKPLSSLKRKRPGKDMRRLLEQNLGPIPGA